METTAKKTTVVVVDGTLPFYFYTDDLIEEKTRASWSDVAIC